MSSATKDVATLSRGTLNSFEMMLKTDMETPAEANSTEPVKQKQFLRSTRVTVNIEKPTLPPPHHGIPQKGKLEETKRPKSSENWT